jgi:hypothetical protein
VAVALIVGILADMGGAGLPGYCGDPLWHVAVGLGLVARHALLAGGDGEMLVGFLVIVFIYSCVFGFWHLQDWI